MKTIKFYISIIVLISITNSFGQSNYRLYVKFKDNILLPLAKYPNIFSVNKKYKEVYVGNLIVYALTKGGSWNLNKNSLREFENDKDLNQALNDYLSCKKNNNETLLLQNLYSPDIYSSFFNDTTCIRTLINHNLLNIFTICHNDIDCLTKLQTALRLSNSIEFVEIEKITREQTNSTTHSNCLTPNSEHWKDYEMDKLWQYDESGYGKNANLIIIEKNTQPYQHCEYDSAIRGLNSTGSTLPHATNVYGLLKSKHTLCTNNEKPITCNGLIPDANIKTHITFNNECGIQTKTDTRDSLHDIISNNSLSNALLLAVSLARKGDIVLLPLNIEMTLHNKKGEIVPDVALPAEFLSSNYLIMALGICKGVTFIEAAGNIGEDLDNYSKKASLGVIVGAVTHFEKKRNAKRGIISNYSASEDSCDCITTESGSSSSFGKIVTCYQIGTKILTTNINQTYCHFVATSAASTIIAGMAGSIQSISFIQKGRYLNPDEMKLLFASTSGIAVFKEERRLNNKFIPTGGSLLKSYGRLNP